MELVEMMDEEYMRSFKLLNNADVNETEMTLSSSSSKYVSAYCRRKTIAIDSHNFPDEIQESSAGNKENLTPPMDLNVTNSGKTVELMDHRIVETMSITEGESLLGQEKQAGTKSLQKLMVLAIFGLFIMVGLTVSLIYSSKTRESTTSSILSASQTPTISRKQPYEIVLRINRAVLMLSTWESSNVPMVITSTGESHFNFLLKYASYAVMLGTLKGVWDTRLNLKITYSSSILEGRFSTLFLTIFCTKIIAPY